MFVLVGVGLAAVPVGLAVGGVPVNVGVGGVPVIVGVGGVPVIVGVGGVPVIVGVGGVPVIVAVLVGVPVATPCTVILPGVDAVPNSSPIGSPMLRRSAARLESPAGAVALMRKVQDSSGP